MFTDLRSILTAKPWVRMSRPFHHVLANQVFTPAFYSSLEEAFKALFSPDKRAFSQSIRGYDAYVAGIPSTTSNPLRVFQSREWHDMLATLFGVRATGDVMAELHHHRPASPEGHIHNDLNPGWFTGEQGPDYVNLASAQCDYKTGFCKGTTLSPRKTVRAVAMLFYLANPPWRPSHGGETGLYFSARDEVARPAAVVRPHGNSLLAFECSPFSFHAFLGTKVPRNSVVLWLHRPFEEACSQWGAHRIVEWKRH